MEANCNTHSYTGYLSTRYSQGGDYIFPTGITILSVAIRLVRFLLLEGSAVACFV
jgi:hypothetical protein